MGMKKPEDTKSVDQSFGSLGSVSDAENLPLLRSKEVLKETITYKPRDYDKEARGKTMALLVAAAIQSPLMALYGTSEEAAQQSEFIAKRLFTVVFPGETWEG